jgi:hypothetical protein
MAKYNVAMHFPDSIAIGWLDSLKGKPDLFPDPYIFTKKLKKKVFSIEEHLWRVRIQCHILHPE